MISLSVIDLRMFSLFASLSSTRVTLMSFLFPKAPAKGVFPKNCCQIHLFNNLHRISYIFCINRTSNQVHHVHLSCILYIPYLGLICVTCSIYIINTIYRCSTPTYLRQNSYSAICRGVIAQELLKGVVTQELTSR